MLRRAESVGSSLRSLAYEAEWAKMLGTGTHATQRLGWQLLSASRPQVGCHVPESSENYSCPLAFCITTHLILNHYFHMMDCRLWPADHDASRRMSSGRLGAGAWRVRPQRF